MTIHKLSTGKVNLLLNILGRRPDGFHELETVMHPVAVCDELTFDHCAGGVQLTCSDRTLPVDATNLVHRAATSFLATAAITEGVKIHLEKRIPMAAGLGGGSGDAAGTLLGLNELFGKPLSGDRLTELASALGSDVPFFLQSGPALATGRGEQIAPLDFFPALRGAHILLIHPGFGIATAWAYRTLAEFPAALNGRPGRAQRLVSLLRTGTIREAAAEFYNSLEAPALHKYPVLALYQEFLRTNGADAALMSGSGSTTFAIVANAGAADELLKRFKVRFGDIAWTAVAPL